ncbi:uncharacterized protein TNCV_3571481 [Trichonephila clavipes]|nr:uncharacterized protein TNCV_3571481 [Trichonephila clavipes]
MARDGEKRMISSEKNRKGRKNFASQITEESATADEGAAKIFSEEPAKIIEDGDYSADQVFNADETGLYWKKLPNRTYIAKDEKTASGHKAKKESLTIKDVWNQFSIFDCLIHVASASAQISPRTLNACWEKIWPACVTDNTTTQTSTLSDEIINLAHGIGGDGFNTFSHDDIDELLVVDALSDNDTIDLTLDLTVDRVVGVEGDNDEEKKSTPLTGKLIQVGLQVCSKLENHFLINDPNSERASKSQHELQNCMSGYRELHWCAKIKDEVEKLAYQLNEETERTERLIRRLSKVMYGSTCADMQVDVMGECLSSIKHVVDVRSVFLAKRLHAV